MKFSLIPENKNAYKSNLHCHTTISDGSWTPEKVKEQYKAKGYSVVAYTDHGVLFPHNDLTDDSFLALNGFEFDVTKSRVGTESPKTCHICFIAKDPEKKDQHIYYNNKVMDRFQDSYPHLKDAPRTHREYTPEFISDVMKSGKDNGFFVTYNHPVWSLERRDQYVNYHGMDAMEIVNYGCILEGYNDRNGIIYDEMLEGGKRIFCIATDDNHDRYPTDHPLSDSFGGYTVIFSDKLEYKSIISSIERGDFYASEGPEIKALYVENGKVHIETSDAAIIIMHAEGRRNKVATGQIKGECISSADFEITDKPYEYIRFTVYDKYGKGAYTNAYFLTDIPADALKGE